MEVKPDTLVNGSLGKVIQFVTEYDARANAIAVVDEEKAGREQRNKTVSSGPAREDEQALNGHVFSARQVWPLVRFENGRQYLCKAVDFTVEGHAGNVEARRLQVPLILAWAISIHKSQGQTIAHLKVDLGRIFENGQGEGPIKNDDIMITCA